MPTSAAQNERSGTDFEPNSLDLFGPGISAHLTFAFLIHVLFQSFLSVSGATSMDASGRSNNNGVSGASSIGTAL
jgi:hypothetical protein